MDANSFAPVMAQIKSAWDMTNTHVGIYGGMAGLIPILVAVPIGEAVRRWGAKRSVIGSMAVIFIGAMIMATAKGFAQGLAGRIFTAGGLRMGTVAAWAGATMVAPASFRTSAWAIMNTALAIGAITGSPLVGGYIGGNFGWQAVFFTISAFSVFCILLIGFFLRMPPAQLHDRKQFGCDRKLCAPGHGGALADGSTVHRQHSGLILFGRFARHARGRNSCR